MKLVKLLIIIILFSDCKPQHQDLEIDEKKIISFIVDEYAIPLPPPPSADRNDTIVSRKVIDSLKNVKLNIGVYPIMGNEINSIEGQKIPGLYKKLLNFDLPDKTIREIAELRSVQGHKIVLADTTVISKTKEFMNFDILFNFSRIRFDKNKTKAILEMSVSRSRLAGYAQIICLNKQGDKWTTVHTELTTTW